MAAIRIRLKELLKERRLTQKELSERTGISRVAISNITRGPSAIRLESIDAICQALEIEPGDLIEYSPKKRR